MQPEAENAEELFFLTGNVTMFIGFSLCYELYAQSFSSGSNTDGDSDNEPLVKMAKVSSKAARKPRTAAPRKSASRKKRASPQKDDSSDDDEPLSQIAKKVRDQYPRRRAAMASKKPPPGRQIPADGGQEKRWV
ncbi:uncharacterized protein ACNS7B_011281 [Menidia menidia]